MSKIKDRGRGDKWRGIHSHLTRIILQVSNIRCLKGIQGLEKYTLLFQQNQIVQ
jgi:hypothetical protein